jgi:hypothetical protein
LEEQKLMKARESEARRRLERKRTIFAQTYPIQHHANECIGQLRDDILEAHDVNDFAKKFDEALVYRDTSSMQIQLEDNRTEINSLFITCEICLSTIILAYVFNMIIVINLYCESTHAIHQYVVIKISF